VVGEVIDPTLLVFAFERDGDEARAEAGIERVRAHYGGFSHEPLERSQWLGPRIGLVALHDPGIVSRWPHWSEQDRLAMASGYIPVGWERLVASSDPAAAAPALARVLRDAPERAARELNSPTVLALADASAERIVLLNDRLGAGRLYELAFAGGRVWSNRVGRSRAPRRCPPPRSSRSAPIASSAGGPPPPRR
jgi:hypothetical protein